MLIDYIYSQVVVQNIFFEEVAMKVDEGKDIDVVYLEKQGNKDAGIQKRTQSTRITQWVKRNR